jgi:formimidoylglutamate deiminase
MSPDQVEAVAAMLYAEMICMGYTHVAEFHYLHNDTTGKPYANPGEMCERLLAAADTAGIKITLVPVLYQKGNFGAAPQPRQRRFIIPAIDDYLHLLDLVSNLVSKSNNYGLGFGVHSLRAVDTADIITVYQQGPKHIPFHLHAAEQLKEVEDCIGYCNQRPVEWLLENLPLSDRFHLVHCTHMNDFEVAALARTAANVVLCPGTEGNLGDGIFRFSDYTKTGGSWSIGTDSHISLNPLEDLRWLDYAQRLVTHKRNAFDNPAHVLLSSALFAGRKAMDNHRTTKFFELNSAFDAVVYDTKSPLLANPESTHLLPSIIFTCDSSNILGTLINGKWIVKNRQHTRRDAIMANYIKAVKNLITE